MAKRGADDSEARSDEDGEQEYAEASPEKLASRTFVKVKRKGGSEPAAEESKVPTGNAFLALVDPTNWECRACEVSNKKELTKCAACEEPRPGTLAAPPAVNAFAALLNPTNWECRSCEVSNKQEATKCAACEEPRPGTEAKPAEGAAAPSGVSFGSAVTFGSTSATPIFGSSSTAPAFSFGSVAPAWNFGTAPFTFGSATTSPVTFGDVSSGTTSTFTTQNPTVFEATGQLATSTDQTREEFKGKSAVPSGTEGDVTIFKVATQAYILTKVEGTKKEDGTEEKAGTKFVECGEGELKINTVESSGVTFARAILRTDKTQRLVLNAPLFPGMTLVLQGEKFVKFCSNDLENKPAVYLLRFKNKTESSLVKDHMERAIAATEK